ncbi:filament-like plant protein [Aristolochia californica]|uniref:filament-like plant protein n=1 Tax=Aristolochia californica TaxID=171875 RepID=UPI0035E1DEF9
MDRRSWLWRRKSSEKSPGETESSGSVSSLSERFSDEQEALRASPNQAQSPEVSSSPSGSDANESDKNSYEKLSDSEKPLMEKLSDAEKTLTEKLSAALLNIRAKEDLVKQHAKVAEEAVTGWEKVEKEAAILKQQLEATVQKNNALEERICHLDGALKECVRQLRHAREEQELKIREAIANKVQEFEYLKLDLETQLSGLQTQLAAAKAEASSSSLDLDLMSKLEEAEKENSALKLELLLQSEELKIKTLERDLSTHAAETASKQHLESIKKVVKLEAECRRQRALARKASSSGNEQRHVSSAYVESLTDSHSDCGDRLNQLETDICKMGNVELNECEPSCSDSWASALIVGLDQFRSEKASNKNLTASSSEFGLMDDFLEMERLVALPEAQEGNLHEEEGCATKQQSPRNSSPSRSELEAVVQRAVELEEKLQRLEVEKADLGRALDETHDQLEKSRTQLVEAEEQIVGLQKELDLIKDLKQASEKEVEGVNTSRKMVQLQLEAADAEVQVLRAKVGSLEMDIEQERTLSAAIKAKYEHLEAELEREKALSEEIKSECQNLQMDVQLEKTLSAEIKAKYQNLEKEISRKREAETRLVATANGELKLKQEKELAVAAGKLAECQKTIASLGRQLKSLASLEDFLLDPEMPELNGLSLAHRGAETKVSHSSFGIPKLVGGPGPSQNGKEDSPPSSSSSSSSGNHGVEKARNGIGKLFSRSRTSVQVENL